MHPPADYFLTIRQLAEYEVWSNRHLIESAGQLKLAQLFQHFDFGLHTLHATLFHTIEVFQLWSGCVGPVIVKPPIESYGREMSLAQMQQWNDDLSTRFLYALDASHTAGLLHQDRRLVQVFHLVTHGTHHRTQFITMLRLLGIDPPFEAGDFGGWSKDATRKPE